MISSVGSLNVSLPINQTAPANLQSAIDANQTTNAIAILKNHNIANAPLPNGQMPLNYAIRHGKLELVEAMLKELKLQTQDKDFQGLTAIDHALITQNTKMIALVIGTTIGQAFDAAATKNLAPNEVLEIRQIVTSVQQVRSGVVSVSPLHEAARKGNLDEVKKLYNRLAPNSYDKMGLSPLHYAALSGKQEIVEWLLQNGERADLLTKTGHSPLLFACIGGHADLISYLIQTQKANPNAVDPKGRTLLHYAMALEDFSSAKALIQNGANPFLKFGGNTTFSPLEMMLCLAKERSDSRDPLALTNLEIYMFAGIVAPWVSQICGVDDPILKEFMPLLGYASTFLSFYQSLKSPKAVALFWASNIGAGLAASALQHQIFYTGDTTGARLLLGLMGVNAAWATYQLGKNVLNGLENAWANRSLETYRPIRNAIVHSVIGMNVANITAQTIEQGLQAKTLIDAWDKQMETEGDTFRNLKGKWYGYEYVSEEERRTNYINTFYARFQNGNNSGSSNNSRSSSWSSSNINDPCYVDPDICVGKSDVECILSLNPETSRLNSFGHLEKFKCENQAQIMLDRSGETKCKLAFRKLNLLYITDKIKKHLYDSNGKLFPLDKIKENLGGPNLSDLIVDQVVKNPDSVSRKIYEAAFVKGCVK